MDCTDNSKQYSLRWEKHAFNLASEAGCFFEDESFLDCTLSAEGQCIDAHKIILSASSSYLSNLLKIMPDKHPILIFNDIKFEQLKSLVAFIYNGSVNVSENNIHAFLNAAQSLLIKGLSEESREEDRFAENLKKHPKNVEVQDMRTNHRTNPKPPVLRKTPDVYLETGKNFKRHRQILSRSEGGGGGGGAVGGGGGGPFVECEESLSKLQEISFTKYIHQNLNSKPHVRSDILESKWNGPGDEKLRAQDNYVVKSWKHNSVEDLNGRHKQNKNHSIKKHKLDKPINLRTEEVDQNDKKNSEPTDVVTGNATDRSKSEEIDDKIKNEVDTEQIMLVEPKQEIVDEEDTNSEEFDSMPNANETIVPDSDSLYDSRSVPNFYQQPVVDRGVPVPLLMCRTSLSEPDSVEPNWMPQIAGNVPHDHPPPTNAIDNNAQDLQCRTCAQDLPCPTCTKKYKSRYALNRHILYECGKARKSFSCDECGKKVTRQDTLQKHKLIHLVQHLKKKESEGPPKPKKMC